MSPPRRAADSDQEEHPQPKAMPRTKSSKRSVADAVGADVTPWKSFPQWSHPADLLEAKTAIVTCGLMNFEDSTYSRRESQEWINSHGRKGKIWPGLLTGGHENYDPQSRKRFLRSFRVNYADLVDGRKIIVIDCTVITNPEKYKKLRDHLGTHPQTWSQVLKHKHFRHSHDGLRKLSLTEKNLIICVCRSGCHRSLASSYSIAPVIKANLYDGDPKDTCVKTANLQEQHHSHNKCNMCEKCDPAQEANKPNLRLAHELLSNIIPKPKATRCIVNRYIPRAVTCRDRKLSRAEDHQPTSTGSRDAPDSSGSHPASHRSSVKDSSVKASSGSHRSHASGGSHPARQPSREAPWHAKPASSGEQARGQEDKIGKRARDRQEGKLRMTLVFNDSVEYHHSFKKEMIEDTRPVIKKSEADHYTSRADVVIEPTRYNCRGFQWQVNSNGPEWKVDTRNQQTRKLTEFNNAYSYTAKRIVSDGPREVQVITVRTIKSRTSAHADGLEPSINHSVVYTLIEMLLDAPPPAIVIGNFGLSVGRIIHSLAKYHRKHPDSAAPSIQWTISRDQHLMCLTFGCSAAQEDQAICPDRLFMVQVRDDNAVFTDGVPEHPATKPSEPAQKKTKVSSRGTQETVTRNVYRTTTPSLPPLRRRFRTETNSGYNQTSDGAHLAENNRPPQQTRVLNFMEMLQNIEGIPEEDSRKQWITYFRPVRPTTSTSDGTHLSGPVDIKETMQRLDDALNIAQKAREMAWHRTNDEATTIGAKKHNVILTKEQLKVAHDWLRYECFERGHITNETLKSRIREREANPHSMTTQQQKKLKDDIRGPYKAWKFQLFGNTTLFHIVIRSGIFAAGDQRRFLQTYEAELQNKEERFFSEAEKEQRRIKAKEARCTLRQAEDLDKKSVNGNKEHMRKWTSQGTGDWDIPTYKFPYKSEAEQQMHAAYLTGDLQRACVKTIRLVQEATQAHQYITMSDAAQFTMSIIEMDEGLRGR